uniref:Uncharacterized protein n=1 Tax=Erwinia amylovora ATCC BAA-2158 TaxID=889211 RepID=E5B4Y4_ERWAM|nr:hypothetical protein predicted by Glimmer/Critica [Erwinia amylovora ATCC BAA-2158]
MAQQTGDDPRVTAVIFIDSFLPEGSQKIHPGIPLFQA